MLYDVFKRAPVARLAAMSLAVGMWFCPAAQVQAQVPEVSVAHPAADVQKGVAVAVAVSWERGRPEIAVNLVSMRQVGMVLPAQVLRLAQVGKEQQDRVQ